MHRRPNAGPIFEMGSSVQAISGGHDHAHFDALTRNQRRLVALLPTFLRLSAFAFRGKSNSATSL
jgi:hypothetical protein